MANFHNVTPTAMAEVPRQIISDEDTKSVMKILMYVVTPCLSTSGIVFNIFSIIILVKHGLQKCSNILLVSLAITDTSFLIAFNNIPNILYEIQGDGRFLYSRPVSHFLYAVYFVFHTTDYIMGLSSLTVPMLITVERIVAVFYPLKFSRIITPVRTWIAVLGVVTYWIVYISYTCFWYRFEYAHDTSINRSVGLIQRTDLFYKDQPIIAALEEIYFSVKIPPLFTLLGCIIIIIKVKIMSKKRTKMTGRVSSTTKTTKMLLAVCFFYIITCALLALPTYLPKNWMSYSLTTDKPSNMGKIAYLVINIFACVNSSWNFLVYVGFNKNFRDTFREMTIDKCRQATRRHNLS